MGFIDLITAGWEGVATAGCAADLALITVATGAAGSRYAIGAGLLDRSACA
jgi:hypothetical protein